MNDQQRAYLQNVLIRIERGLTTRRDADWLWAMFEQLQGDIATLTAILEDALVFECGVTFPEEAPQPFDGAGTA